MSEFERLADGFPPAREADWQRLAEKGAEGGVARLRSYSGDGFPVGPIYPPGRGAAGAMRPGGRPWTVVDQVSADDPDLMQATTDFATHTTGNGVEFLFIPDSVANRRNRPEFHAVAASLSGIAATARGLDVPLWIDAGVETVRFAREVASRALVHCVYDPHAVAAAGGNVDPETDFAGIADLIRTGHRGIAVTSDGRRWHNAGATEVQELAIAVASAVGALHGLVGEGIAPGDAWRGLGLRLAADADQFLTIAKFRAARLLLARVAEVSGLDARPPIHAETSWRMLGAREPMMDLVRATTGAFAAAAGGADAITVLPPMIADRAFAARMARNVQLILGEESSLARTADPGAGSGAVEALTAELAAEAWGLFTRIEAEGGLAAAIRSGLVIDAVATARDGRLEAVARRRIPLVGINVNVDPDAPLPVLDPAPDLATDGRRLQPMRLAEPFERLAVLVAAAMAGEPAIVLRAGKGGDPDLADGLAALGMRTRVIAKVDDLASPPRLACVVFGPDDRDRAADLAASLRGAGAGVLLATTSEPGADAPWCDAIVTPDSDLVALFAGLLDRIAQRPEKEQV